NIHDGTFLAREAITVLDNKVINPGTHLAWYIETNAEAFSIYNDDIAKYVSYTGSSNNIQIVDNVSSNNQLWDITYSSGNFLFNNAQITNRRLQYNSGSPRFVAYTGSQQDLQLYKYTIPT